ncbi:MAG TPA: type II toxin-antitoxin system RelE/ParE family toxin [Terracidiphilus sp.]|nr:type II toxin-antitoxin system RelE/ParE family toxin [Terracidiphilus sp.]
MKSVSVHPQAEADAEGAFDWYWTQSPLAALRFHSELMSKLRTVPHASSSSPPHVHGTRRILLHRFPYSIVFRELLHEIQIIAVAHAKRRPGYWAARL